MIPLYPGIDSYLIFKSCYNSLTSIISSLKFSFKELAQLKKFSLFCANLSFKDYPILL